MHINDLRVKGACLQKISNLSSYLLHSTGLGDFMSERMRGY